MTDPAITAPAGTMDDAHDPFEQSALLAKKLGSRERHVCFLLGAGASKAAGLPDVAGLKEKILEREAGRNGSELAALLAHRTVEEGLSWLRKAAAFLEADSDQIGSYTKANILRLDTLICTEIMDILTSASTSPDSFQRFARWLLTTTYTRAVEIFTLNYDLLLEEARESMSVPYFDGFSGTYQAHFRPDLVDNYSPSDGLAMPAFFHRVWKLHGSVSWTRDDQQQVVRRGRVASAFEVVAIHPSESKYDDSRRAPYVILHDRLRRALLEPETMLIVSGYSFGDQHINEVIFDAVKTRPRSEFVFIMFGEPDEQLRQFACDWGNVALLAPRIGVIGGVQGTWTAMPDAPQRPEIWNDEDGLKLGDFARLSEFLSKSVMREQRQIEPPHV